MFPQVIDSSMLATYKACPARFKNLYIDNWHPKGESVHLRAGAAFAKGIEAARRAFFEDNKDEDTSVATGLGRLLEAYGSFECPADSAKSAERMVGALEFYFDNYPLGRDGTAPIKFPGGRLGIEFTFAEPLPIQHPESNDPLIYSGAMDAVLEYDGLTLITDEKTTSSLGASWSRQWDLRSQFTGYAWGCKAAGIKVDGVLVRGISILKTKYDTLQAISYRPNWMIERWYEELIVWVTEIKQCYLHNTWKHNLDHSCTEYGGCSFRDICLSQDPTNWLETYFEKRRWDPIQRKEVPV